MSLGFDRSVTARLKADVSDYVAKMAVAGRATQSFLNDINTSNNRMTALTQTALALGPALIPTLAAAVPAVAGLSSGLVVTAAAGGVFELAMHGIGDALSAVNKYQLQPTQANFDAMRLKMKAIGPDGAQFVHFLSNLTPQLRELQTTARAGLFPGVEDGLQSLLSLTPEVADVIGTVSTTLGDLASKAGTGLADSPEWHAFFDYLNNHARPILSQMGHVIGDVTTGLADMLLAADPLSQTFGSDLQRMAADFHHWASQLATDPGFQSFIDYVERETPEAGKTLATIAEALLAILQAGAPVGQAMLPMLRALATVVKEIAQSPIGPVLFGAAAAMSALARSIALFRAVNGSAVLSLLGQRGASSAVSSGAVAAAERQIAPIGLSLPSGATTTLAFRPIPAAAIGAQRRFSLSALATEQSLRGAALAAGILGSVLSEKIPQNEQALHGLADAANGALIGFGVGGPIGAAIGAGAAGLLDLYKADQQLNDELARTRQYAQSNPFDFAGQIKTDSDAFNRLTTQAAEYSAVGHTAVGATSGIGVIFNWLGGKADDAATSVNSLTIRTSALRQGFAEFSATLANGRLTGPGFAAALGSLDADVPQLVTDLTNLGYSKQRIEAVMLRHKGFDAAIAAVRNYRAVQNTVPTVIQGVTDKATTLNGVWQAEVGILGSASASLDDYKTSLDNLTQPGLQLDAAQSAIQQGFADLNATVHASAKQFKDSGTSLSQFTQEGRNNRAQLRGMVTNITSLLEAQKQHGASVDQLTHSLKFQTAQLIAHATQAGLDRDKVKALLVEYGLTPKLIRTLMELQGTEEAKREIRVLQKLIDNVHGKTVDIGVRVQQIGADMVATGIGQVRPFASGTSDAPGGYALVGERGPELVRLPRHSRVYRADQTAAILSSGLPRFAAGGVMSEGAFGSPFAGPVLQTVITSDPAMIRELASIKRQLAGTVKTEEQKPYRFAKGMQDIARDEVDQGEAYAAAQGRTR